jgi:hypothetical protein
MKTSRDTSSENDVLYQFALSYRHPNPQLLDDFVRRHPGHADALTTLAIELALEDLVGNEDRAVAEPSEAEPEPETAAMLSRAMSRFQNRLHAVRTAQDAATAPRPTDPAESLRDPFARRTTEQMRIVIMRLDASPLFVMRLRDRGIDAATMTAGFIRRVAEALEEPEVVVRAHFAAPAQVQLQGLYKSDMTPYASQKKLIFEEAVRTSGLTPEQQARLLAL